MDMFRDAFSKLDVLEAETLLKILNPLLGGSPFDMRHVTVLGMDLSFYPGHRFMEIADHSVMPPRRVFAIQDPAKVMTLLDWTNGPIYALNTSAPIRLTDKNVTEYVRFYFNYTRGRHGRFLITETIDDIAWREEPPASARKAIGGLIEPLRVIGMEDDGTFVLNARLIFKDSLFKARILVRPDGQVGMSDEELVIEDIPVMDDALGQ